MQMIKESEGITLVSLTVMIIIIFILAGIGLNVSFIAVNEARDNKLNGELGIVRQAIIERYSMALAVNEVKVRASEEQVSFWVGERVQDEDSAIQFPDELLGEIEEAKEFLVRSKQTSHDYQEDYYYRLTPEQLKKIGISNSDYTYIVNYKTGEVYNETKKVDHEKNLLYLPPIKEAEDDLMEDTTSFNDWNNT